MHTLKDSTRTNGKMPMKRNLMVYLHFMTGPFGILLHIFMRMGGSKGLRPHRTLLLEDGAWIGDAWLAVFHASGTAAREIR